MGGLTWFWEAVRSVLPQPQTLWRPISADSLLLPMFSASTCGRPLFPALGPGFSPSKSQFPHSVQKPLTAARPHSPRDVPGVSFNQNPSGCLFRVQRPETVGSPAPSATGHSVTRFILLPKPVSSPFTGFPGTRQNQVPLCSAGGRRLDSIKEPIPAYSDHPAGTLPMVTTPELAPHPTHHPELGAPPWVRAAGGSSRGY